MRGSPQTNTYSKMCSPPRVPKQPKVQSVASPATPQETAQQVGRSSTAQSNMASKGTLGRFDLRLPPSFQIGA